MLTDVNPWEVPLDPPTEFEAESNIRLLLRENSRVRKEMSQVISKLDGNALTKTLVSLVRDIWDEKRILVLRRPPLIVSFFKNGTRSDRSNHSGISLAQ